MNNTMRKAIAIPAVTLKLLIGEGAVKAATFRRNAVERFWPCGGQAHYQFDKSDDVQWTPCRMHEPALSHIGSQTE
jgi:hypothetical protein